MGDGGGGACQEEDGRGDGLRGGWDESYERFEESPSLNRRFSGREEEGNDSSQEDFYRPRRTSRAAIPEQAASRSIRNRASDQESWKGESDQARRMARFGNRNEDEINNSSFGERRNLRQDQRRGSRPSANQQTSNRRRNIDEQSRRPSNRDGYSSSARPGTAPKGSPIRDKAEDATFSPSRSRSSRLTGNERTSSNRTSRTSRYSSDTQSGSSAALNAKKPRDNSSRFDD